MRVQRAFGDSSLTSRFFAAHGLIKMKRSDFTSELINTRSPSTISPNVTVAVLLPSYNEEATIGKVVTDFQHALPNATIYVFDNNSTDETSRIAAAAGAAVRKEQLQGKGHTVRRMFADIEADAFVMVDGDDTYDASAAPYMVELLLRERLDMVVGRRIDSDTAAYRTGHRFGNAVLTGTVSWLFGARFQDMLSGYRVFSRRFVKSFPVFSPGFEIEAEITVHALTLQMPIQEVPTTYRPRPRGSVSKLHTYQDGFRILKMIFDLVRGERPLLFFSLTSFLFAIVSLSLGYPIVMQFLRTGLVPRFPTAILATGVAILSALSLASAFVLDTVTRSRRSAIKLSYLAIPRWEPSHPHL